MARKKKEDTTYKFLTDLIDELFTDHYSEEQKAKDNTPFYESIEDYTATTGKRFRMTKEQKTRNLSREDAFTETFGDYDR